jgi:hypothetical protein
MEWAWEKKIGGLRGRNRREGREEWAGCWANFGEKNKKWPRADMGDRFLYNFQNSFYKL